jgi:CRP-like cAMP-binding protein
MSTTIDLFRKEEAVDFAAGEVIFREGEIGEAMYAIQEGEVELRIGDTVLEVLGAGQIVGEMALVDHSPRSATAIARTACKVVVVPERRFLFLVQQTPFFALQVMRVMAERLRRASRR